MKRIYALTKENLVFNGLYDDFFEYKEILLSALSEVAKESYNKKLKADCIEKIKTKANKKLVFRFFAEILICFL